MTKPLARTLWSLSTSPGATSAKSPASRACGGLMWKVTRRELVLLPSGLRVRAPTLCVNGELLWSPPGARTEAKVVESTESVHGDNITPGQCPWRGRSRAFLFDSWESVGQGRGSSNIQEMWPGGARRWLCVTKLNTTTECRCSGWTGHLCGSGAARELGPSSSTRRVM